MKKQNLLIAGVFFLMPLILMAQNSTVNSGKLTPTQMTGSMAKGFDSHGNWMKRKVAATLKSTEYVEDSSDKVNIEKKNLVETRTITYYP